MAIPFRGAFGRSNNLLADDVIDVRRETSLLRAPLAKQPLRTLGSLGLKPLSKSIRPTSQAIQMRAGEVLPVTRCGDVDDADVHAQPAEDFLLFGVGHVYGDEQVKLAISKHEVCLATIERKKLPLVLATYERDHLALRQGPDTRRVTLPREATGVVGDRSKRPKASFRLLVELVGVRNLGDRTNDHL